MDRYAEHHRKTFFDIDPGTIQFLAVVFDATVGTQNVSVAVARNSDHPLAGEVIKGVARHVVNPDNDAFPSNWTPESRLRITSGGEFFVALKDIAAIFIEE